MTLSLSACSSLLVDEIFPFPDSDAGYLGAVGLNDDGFPVLLSSQRGSSSPLDWGEAEVNGSYDPLLPNAVGNDGQPVAYSALTSVASPVNGDWVCQIFGLGLNDGLPYLASLYDTNAQQWQPGMCLAQYMSSAVPLSSLGATFWPPDSPASGQTLLLIGLGRDDGQMYVVATQSASGVWLPNQWPMSGGLGPLTALVPCAAAWESQLTTVVLALDNMERPWLAWYLSSGGGLQPSPAGWYTGQPLPCPPPFQGYTALSEFTDPNSGYLYVLGLGKNDNLPYLIAYLMGIVWVTGWALPNVEQVSQPVQYSTLLVAATPQGEVDVIGLGLCDHQPYLVASSTDPPNFSAGSALPNCQSYGQPVPYAALQMATDQVDNTHLFGLGLDDGQIYHAAWLPYGADAWQQGQGLLPSAYATSWTDAQAFVSMMVAYPGVAATLVNNLQQDVAQLTAGAPLDLPSTQQYISSLDNPLTPLKLDCSLLDVARAGQVALAGTLNLWAGVYGTISAGSGWPAGKTPAYLYVTGCGSVFYGDYDLASSNWQFADSTLSWEAGSEPGAPPVAGAITFQQSTPAAPGPGGYFGPYFTGTLNGCIGPIAPDQPPLAKPARPPAVASIAASARSIYVGQSFALTVALDAPAQWGDTVVTLWTDSAYLTIPNSVTIPAFESSADVTIGPFNPPWPGHESLPATISAVCGGDVARAVTVTLFLYTAPSPADAAVGSGFTLSLNPSTILGGQDGQATVTLDSPVGTDTLFDMSSGDPQYAAPGTPLTVPANEQSGSVIVTTSVVTSVNKIQINAENLAYGERSAVLTIHPIAEPPHVSSLTFNPCCPVTGGQTTLGTLQLSYTPTETTTITFTSSVQDVPAPTDLIVQAGNEGPTFEFAVPNVDAQTDVTITAQIGSTAACPGTLTIAPLPLDNTLTWFPLVIKNTATAVVTLTLSSPLAAPAAVTLVSGDPSYVAVNDATVNLGAGQDSAQWNVVISAPTEPAPILLFVTSGGLTIACKLMEVYPAESQHGGFPPWLAAPLIGLGGIVVETVLGAAIKWWRAKVPPTPAAVAEIQQATAAAATAAAQLPIEEEEEIPLLTKRQQLAAAAKPSLPPKK